MCTSVAARNARIASSLSCSARMRSISTATACSSAVRTPPGLAAHRASRSTQSARFLAFNFAGCISFCQLLCAGLLICMAIAGWVVRSLIGRRCGAGQTIVDHRMNRYQTRADSVVRIQVGNRTPARTPAGRLRPHCLRLPARRRPCAAASTEPRRRTPVRA